MLADYTSKPIEFEGQFYDHRHGGPFDRGAADSYYDRGHNPHYYVAGTGPGPAPVVALTCTT